MNQRNIRACCPPPPAAKLRVPHPSQLHRDGWDRIFSRRRALFASILLSAAILCAAPLHAQGCTQCRDNTAATPPATQRAYRHAIILLGGTASIFFIATVATLRKRR